MRPIVNQSDHERRCASPAPGACGDGSDTCARRASNPAHAHAQGRCGYGPRLPLLVISPWAKQNFVDHTRDRSDLDPPLRRGQLAGRAAHRPGFVRHASPSSINNMFDFEQPGQLRHCCSSIPAPAPWTNAGHRLVAASYAIAGRGTGSPHALAVHRTARRLARAPTFPAEFRAATPRLRHRAFSPMLMQARRRPADAESGSSTVSRPSSIRFRSRRSRKPGGTTRQCRALQRASAACTGSPCAAIGRQVHRDLRRPTVELRRTRSRTDLRDAQRRGLAGRMGQRAARASTFSRSTTRCTAPRPDKPEVRARRARPRREERRPRATAIRRTGIVPGKSAHLPLSRTSRTRRRSGITTTRWASIA